MRIAIATKRLLRRGKLAIRAYDTFAPQNSITITKTHYSNIHRGALVRWIDKYQSIWTQYGNKLTEITDAVTKDGYVFILRIGYESSNP